MEGDSPSTIPLKRPPDPGDVALRAIEHLDGLAAGGRREAKHREADACLAAVLKAYGHADVVEAWVRAKDRVGFKF
jgi:hypothetical protein